MKLAVLMQDQVWPKRDGSPVALAEMEIGHARNVVAMLDRAAARIERAYSMAEIRILSKPLPTVIGEYKGESIYAPEREWTNSMPSGDMASDAFDREIHERAENPVRWLHTMPLLEALDRRINACG